METSMPNTPRLCLSFVQGEHAYLVDIQQVKETVGFRLLSPAPGAATSIVGVVHRNGTPVPVVELCHPCKPLSARAERCRSIVILDARFAEGWREVGVMTDAFPDIVDLGESPGEGTLLNPAQLLPAVAN